MTRSMRAGACVLEVGWDIRSVGNHFSMRRQRLLFGVVAIAIFTVVPLAAIVGVDVYLHGKFQTSAGYNIWGYRGPSVPQKRPHEYRAVMVGGSSAYGYGAKWDEAIPAVLERRLAQRPGLPPTSVVNLGYNNEGAYSLRFTLEDYLWLDYDLALFYEGYNDIMTGPLNPNVQVFRRESPVFRLTGYLPIFPVIFREKAAAMLTNGQVESAYAPSQKTVFRPGVATRGAAGALTAAADVGRAIENQLARVTTAPPGKITDEGSTGCAWPWPGYCRSVLVAVEFQLAHGKQVLVIGQPHFPQGHPRHDRHLDQQRELSAMIARKFSGNPRVRYVDVGDAVDLSDPSKSFDGMHLTHPGNELVAGALVEPVAAMIQQPATKAP